MSYDVYLLDPRGWAHRVEGCPQQEREYNGTKFMDVADGHECPGHTVEVGNYTYNVSPMWADALGGGASIGRFDEAPCVEAAGLLAEACARMEGDPAKYRAMNPPNGWGDYDSALRFLQRFASLCETYPEYRIRVS